MIHEVALPTQGTLFKFTRNGVVILSVEAVYLDMLLASSQRSSRQSRVNEDDRLWWLPTFTALINAKYGTDFTDTEAWLMARSVNEIADQLKKSFESMRKSLQQTAESIRSDSLETSEKLSTSTSPPSEPVASLENEPQLSP